MQAAFFFRFRLPPPAPALFMLIGQNGASAGFAAYADIGLVHVMGYKALGRRQYNPRLALNSSLSGD